MIASGNVMTSLEKDVGNALRIDDVDKPASVASDTPATDTAALPAPEAPIPETFTEADARELASQPLAITQEVQPQPAPIQPATPDHLKDAKAS